MIIVRKILFLILLMVFLLVPSQRCALYTERRKVDDLVRQWSPLVWLSPDEIYMPSNVEDFLRNVYVADQNGKKVLPYFNRSMSKFKTKDFNLVTYRSIENLKNDTHSFIYGKNPTKNSVSIYALVTNCVTKNENEVQGGTQNLHFHVTYWIFYPFNEGKEFCLLGRVPTIRIFNRCLGQIRTLGNHIGDWEHMSLSFAGKPVPELLYLAVHDTGSYYSYNEKNRYFKLKFREKRKGVQQVPTFPEILRTQGEHPVIFSAKGSHGMWSTPGEQEYIRIPKLIDKTGYGIPWKTWSNIKIHHIGRDHLPYWMNFRGKWGNQKRNCLLSSKLGICEYSDGPAGILRPAKDFYCPYIG